MRSSLLLLVACAGAPSAPPPTTTTTTGTATATSDTAPRFVTWCGNQACDHGEDETSCPWDCVPYTVEERGSGGRACERTYTGFVPLPELGPGWYLDEVQGGLYPGGSNARPADHTAEGVARAEAIAPIDGQICVMSVGMSNTAQKWAWFTDRVAPEIEGRAPAVVLAQGAVGSNPVDTTADPEHRVWATIENQLSSAGCALDTVQVAWILHAERGPTGSFLEAREQFVSDLRATVLNLAHRAPRLSLVYLSPRAYAGYGTRNNNPEPYAHQGGFAIQALIGSQIEGTDPDLALDAGAPWLSWGPYLWADGLGPDGIESTDQLEYACEDFSDSDGIHPGGGSRRKVGAALEAFFTTDPTVVPWFLE